MSDDPVTRLNAALTGRYRIEEEVGEGGMATVYLAEDLRHGRKVAIKVLRPELAAVVGSERFLAEIRTTANLQHPSVLPLFDSGEAEGFLFYVMPYVEGESLRDRLDREHQLPVNDAVGIAIGLAEALDHAHRHGIVHRDIKPANVLLLDGKPVLSDFGIALAVGSAGGGRLTETGLSLGTPHYMSPEQATGDATVGPSADIYALGCVLYEMLVGDPPHTGSTAQAVLAKIITEPPPRATRARRSVPPNVAAAVEKALEKLPADRFASTRGFAEALTDPGFRHGPEDGAVETPGDGAAVGLWKRRATLLSAVAGVLAILVGSLGWALTQAPAPRRDPVTLQIHLPDSARLDEIRLAFVPSREGERLVMVSGDGFVVRDLTSLDLDLIPLEGARGPFASPDGEWIGFFSGASRRLEKVTPEGGARIPLGGDAPLSFGATWGPDGRIVYAPAVDNGLWLVRDGEGTPEQLTTPDAAAGELGHWRPTFLPDGRTVLFTVYRSPLDSSSIEALDLETGRRTWILDGGHHARYVDSGHLVFAYYEALHAVSFDPEVLEVTGPRAPVVSDVVYEQANALAGYAVSDRGTLAYVRRSSWESDGRLVWVDRTGSPTVIREEWDRAYDPVLSPGNDRIAFGNRSESGRADVWVYHIERAQPVRVTQSDRINEAPVWSADGQEIFYLQENFDFDLYRRGWQAGSPAEPVLLGDFDDRPTDVSPDGAVLALQRAPSGGAWDLWTLRLDEDASDPTPFLEAEGSQRWARFSPDGRWLAYQSDESGRAEVWVAAYPDPTVASPRQVSNGGGTVPRWGAGGELFFQNGDRMMAVRIDLTTGEPGVPTELFRGSYRAGFDVTPDGRRFLMVEPRSTEERREVVVVLNWTEELKRIVGR